MAAIPRATRALAVIGLLALAFPAATVAAAPERFDDHRVFVNCSLLAAETADAYVSFSTSERFGPAAGLQIWVHPDDIISQPPTLVSGTPTIGLSPDGTTISGTVELLPGDGGIASAGSATLMATVAPAGPAETNENRFGDGNRKHRESDTFGPLSVGGSLTVTTPGRPDVVFSLATCTGLVSDVSVFTSAPSSSVTWGDEQILLCTYVDDELYVGLHAESSGGLVSADMVVLTPTAVLANVGEAPVTLDRRTFGASFELASTGAGVAEVSGIASASAVLTALEATSFELRRDGGRTRITIQPFSALGSMDIALTDGTQDTVPLDDVTCHTNEAYSERAMMSSADGGNRQPIGNDEPGAARTISAGQRVSQHTGGAAFEGEAFATCVWEGPTLLNVAHSAWYAIEGTGGPITFDTSGSSFDTVVAAYVADGEALTEVACNDESFGTTPHQASLTFETEVGVTYLVQIGGYVDQSGHLRLRVS